MTKPTRKPESLVVALATALLIAVSGPVAAGSAEVLTANMDRSADPTEDFYRYAAGGWLDRTEISPAYGLNSPSLPILLGTDDLLVDLAEEAASKGGAKSVTEQQVGDFFTSGMNTQALNARGLTPIEDFLSRIDAIESAADLAAVSALLQRSSSGSPLMVLWVEPDRKDNTTNVIYLSTSVAHARKSSLERHEYVEEGNQVARDAYLQYLATLFEAAGDSPETAASNASTVFALERDLSASAKTPEEEGDYQGMYNKLTVAEVKALAPAFDFDTWFGAFGIKPPQTLIVGDPDAISGIQAVLAVRSMDEIKTLMRGYLLAHAAPFLGAPYDEASLKFGRDRIGLPESPPRELNVIRVLEQYFGQPLSKLYLEDHFTPEAKAEIEDVAERIRQEFIRHLEGNTWLSAPARAKAIEKVNNIQVKVGFPDTEADWIDYSGIEIVADDFAGNVQRCREFTFDRMIASYGKPVHRDPFSVPMTTTPIAYNAGLHQNWVLVEVTAAFAQEPFYRPDADPAILFGGIGAVMGHEMTHGFDSKGRNYDPYGNMIPWWTEADIEYFNQQAARLVEQYNSYELLPGAFVNGELTLAENIADIGGLTLAYDALQTYMAQEGRLPDIDGLTPEQRFFIAWAQGWMSKYNPEVLKRKMMTDSHSPSEVRAFAPASNMAPFYEAFDIGPEDKMWRPPEERVVIW